MGVLPVLAVAPAVPGPAAEVDRAVVARHDEFVAVFLRDQVTDSSSRRLGGVADGDGLFGAGSAANALCTFYTAFLQPASKYYRAPAMVERAKLAAGFLERSQSPDGNISLIVTNFNSPPDTGFVVHHVASAACLAHGARNRELLGMVEPFLKKAGAGLAKGGVHTPNHRWVVCAALAQIHEVFPDAAYPRRIGQWLAEGIDIDGDGQYTERSTGVYNGVVDRALVVMAAKLKRPELLVPVRKNLESMMYFLHPGYEVVTEISRRQDQYEIKNMGLYWFALQFMAAYGKDGRYAALADNLAPGYASLTSLMEYPELNVKIPHQPLPDNYEKTFPELRAVRLRRGAMSSTIILDSDSHFLSFRRGAAVIASVRFASAFFGKGQFVPKEFTQRDRGFELSQILEAGYFQPLGTPRFVAAGEWGKSRSERRKTEVCTLSQSAIVTPTDKGVKLRIRAEGTAGVPLAVEFALRDGGKLTGCERRKEGWLLREGYATYRVGNDVVRFGPGKAEHHYLQVRGAQPAAPGTRVYLCGYTPFDHEVEIA